MLVRCNACQGRKQVIKLGMLEGDCDTCGGIGYTTLKEALEPVIEKAANEMPIIEAKKRGRKPRQMQIDG